MPCSFTANRKWLPDSCKKQPYPGGMVHFPANEQPDPPVFKKLMDALLNTKPAYKASGFLAITLASSVGLATFLQFETENAFVSAILLMIYFLCFMVAAATIILNIFVAESRRSMRVMKGLFGIEMILLILAFLLNVCLLLPDVMP
ncbi:hypothetical protein AMTR_s00146p00051640 [Amborella trichopoda]|uniref:Uncharacterized protein n=1 Tax=Amborella trichopoda TaxID=13333 RepID=W1PAW9_AMBTC|nr:hypothetical protein AMTR_s00146p00051640 [Amborella trichopoda]